MYEFGSRIRYSEVDEHGLLRPESLINYYQDCSTFQSEEGGVGIGYLKDRHMAWIVSYWQIEVNRYPTLSEKVRIGTIPYDMKGGFLGLRNFYMDTEEGERLAVANSVWALMDLGRMAPVKEPPEMEKVYALSERLPMTYLPRKVQMPKGTEAVERKVVQVTETDLDSNHHVNNARYVRFAMGLMPEESIVSGIRVEYKKQVLLGEKIHLLVYPDREADAGTPAGAAAPAGTAANTADPAGDAADSGAPDRVIPIEMRADDGSVYCTMEFRIRPRLAAETDSFMR